MSGRSSTPRQLLTRVQIEAWRAWYHDGAGTMLPAGTFDDLCDTALLLGETQQSEIAETNSQPGETRAPATAGKSPAEKETSDKLQSTTPRTDALMERLEREARPYNYRWHDWADLARGLELELEREQICHAACGVAALGYHPKEGISSEYKSASLDDVLRLREKCDELEAQLSATREIPKPDAAVAVGAKSVQLSYFTNGKREEALAAFVRWIA
jgi:hypothetical protein